jgi:hypothetical protein
LTDLWDALWLVTGSKSVGGSKGVWSLGRRAGVDVPPEKGRQGASMA